MNRTTVRRFAPAALLTSALLAVSSAAVAAPPPPRPDFPPGVVVPAGAACDFALGIAGTGAKARIKTFANGSQIISGKGYLLTYTNADTGKSVSFETNGTSEHTSAPDADNVVTITSRGSTGLILFPPPDASNVPGVGAPSAIQYTGRIVFTFDLDDGQTTLLSASGTQRDLCAELS